MVAVTRQSIKFPFDKRRATAAAATILKKEGGPISYMRMIKLLYLADRKSIDEFGRPIVGGHYVSMDYGPVLSEVLDLVKDNDDEIWSPVIRKNNFDVEIVGEPDLGPLSLHEVRLLEEAVTCVQTLDKWKIVEYTHTLPEWKNPNGSSLPITPEDILRALHKPDEAVEEIRQASDERNFFAELFTGAP